jgi:CheY-like chemotaxis protein
VVVIDDDPDSCMLLRIFFEEMGSLVEVANSGSAGIELARRIQPDLITLDLMMPEENGWIVAQKLKDDAELHRIPVLIVSIVADDFRGGSFGILGAVEKPVSKERMLQAVIEVMAAKRTSP